MWRKRIWCETVSVETLTSRAVVDLLARFSVDPIVAVRPGGQGSLGAAIERLREAGLRPCIWPMLDDAAGRWGSAWNATAFAGWAREVARAAGDPGVSHLEIALDLEPPIALMAWAFSRARGVRRRLAGARPGARLEMRQAADVLRALNGQLRADGFRTIAVVAPVVLLDERAADERGAPGPGGGWQDLLGTPVDGIAWDAVAVMAYSSIVRGWSRGLLDQRAVDAVVQTASALAVRRWGRGAVVALGAVGTGALGDEPVYAHVGELERDVVLARSQGVGDIALFELGGVLGRAEPERWLAALDADWPGAGARPSWRARVAISAATAVSRIVGAAHARWARSRGGPDDSDATHSPVAPRARASDDDVVDHDR